MSPKVRAFDIDFDALTLDGAVEVIAGWVGGRTAGPCRYVVTPNVDHLIRLEKDTLFLNAYRNASMALTDGRPVCLALRLLGRPVPRTVPGSDLVPAVFDYCQNRGQGLKIFLLGATEMSGRNAGAAIESRWKRHTVAGRCSPSPGFERRPRENRAIVRSINACNPDFILVGLGAPKQEIWMYEHHRELTGSVAVCGGAVIDFLSGAQKRAPVWMQRASLEWLYRMAGDPGRLSDRYARNAVEFPGRVLREWRALR